MIATVEGAFDLVNAEETVLHDVIRVAMPQPWQRTESYLSSWMLWALPLQFIHVSTYFRDNLK